MDLKEKQFENTDGIHLARYTVQCLALANMVMDLRVS
jgi:hypothetical protein